MGSGKIRVGIIGANPERGWAVRAHIPALRALSEEYEITAVGTSQPDSAKEAARKFGVAHSFTDPHALAAHPEVDVVAITVKVPAHAELIQAALGAGKHVYSEWPLALTTDEAALLAKEAAAAGVHSVIGLQARYAPAVAYARELITDGHLGNVNSVTVYSAREKGSTGETPVWSAYTFDKANGAGLLEVGGGHTLDAVTYLLGDFTELSATLALRNTQQKVAGTGEAIEVTSPDQLLLNGILVDGVLASAHLHDAKVSGARTRIEISGTQGDLAIVSTGGLERLGVQISELRLLGSTAPGAPLQEIPIPAKHNRVGEVAVPEAFHVAGLYRQLADDIRAGTHHAPDFEAGLKAHRVLDAIRESSRTGIRQQLR